MNELRDDDILTPKFRRSAPLTTSTVDNTKGQKRRTLSNISSQLDSSLSILSLNNVDLSNIGDVNNVDQALLQQRQLANNTLSRASKVGAIPSYLLKPEMGLTCNETNAVALESTVNESDLLLSIKETSTPRTSSADGASRDSIFARFKEMLDTNMSTHNAVEEFKQIAMANKSIAEDSSSLFLPAEEAAAKLMADELSWKQKYAVPSATSNTFQQSFNDVPSMSIGEFFQRGSDSDISELRATSPVGRRPVALIDNTVSTSTTQLEEDKSCLEHGKSLSISAIQQLLEQETPNKVMNYLWKQNEVGRNSRRFGAEREASEVFSLPVSRDASYTTSFSDNEAVRVAAQEDKENVRPRSSKLPHVRQPITTQPTLTNDDRPEKPPTPPPSRSSSSLSSLPNGKLPIESTVSELVWGCVKVDRCATKQFMLRNKTPKTLRLQCSVSSYEYKIRKENRSDSDCLSACKFVLHGHESRALIVSFTPTKVGPAVDELVFTPLDTNLTQTKKQCVRLWGYGGYSNVEFQNASRDNTGKYWLSLGRMDNRLLMEQQFTVRNVGNLPSFSCIKVVPKHIVTFSSLKCDPNLFVLLPNEEKTVTVSYRPNAKDCRVLKQNFDVLTVIDIGKLEIVSGCEVNRARLRRLNRKCSEKGLNVDRFCKIIVQKIPGEAFPVEVNKFKENPSAAPEILDTLTHEEMVVTIEQNQDQTLVEEYPEDSVIYQSLCAQDETLLYSPKKSCRLEPPSVVLVPPTKLEDRLFLISESDKTLHFEVRCNPKGLDLSPTDGAISPNETAEFTVRLRGPLAENTFNVFVYVENEVFEAEVRVLNAPKAQAGRRPTTAPAFLD